jgi:hypothetical protein
MHHKNWIAFFAMVVLHKPWITAMLLGLIRRVLVALSHCEGERMELYAILLAAEVMAARDDMAADEFKDRALDETMHEADERHAAEVVLENLGETMHSLLGERLTMILQYRETSGPFGEFGRHGGSDL